MKRSVKGPRGCVRPSGPRVRTPGRVVNAFNGEAIALGWATAMERGCRPWNYSRDDSPA